MEDPSLLLVLGLGAVVFILFWNVKAKRSSQARASLKTLLDDPFEFQPDSPTEERDSRERGGSSKKKTLQNPFEIDPRDEDD